MGIIREDEIDLRQRSLRKPSFRQSKKEGLSLTMMALRTVSITEEHKKGVLNATLIARRVANLRVSSKYLFDLASVGHSL